MADWLVYPRPEPDDAPTFAPDRDDPTELRDYGPPRLREMLTPDPREALVFLLIVATIVASAYRWA